MTDKERIENLKSGNIPKRCEECFFSRKVVNGNILYYECLIEDRDKYHIEDIDGYQVKVLNCPLKTIQSVQNEKAVEALQKVKEQIDDEFICESDYKALDIVIDKIIKEYGGKNE